jgi:alginate O-acetyltransferase complex protein AlgI
MLFNSYQFIFAYLPVTLGLFYLLGRHSRHAGLGLIILASLVFYAWWRPLNVAIILPSILINFALARRLQRLAADPGRESAARMTLTLGVLFNVAFLGYFKYMNFFQVVANDALGTHFALSQVILPLGISFITFQKIAFLVDVHGRRVEHFTFREYALFVLFFPQLIAGPIVHYREVMPQFARLSCRPDTTNIAVGLTLFVCGLFKKAVLADGIAPYVTSIYERAAHGDPVSLAPALLAAIGFTLQIYFDFSGYTDMALGIARLFGVRLPANFNSPLKASSIIDYWLRWHITLSRFLTAYIYNPMVMHLTRARIARGRAILNNRRPNAGAFVVLLAFPTLVTMGISGLWHGAGYTFIIWGLLHGIFLIVNHAWRLWRRQRSGTAAPVSSGPRSAFASWLLTFTCVVFAMVFFKAATPQAAWVILKGICGGYGVGAPTSIYDHLGPIASLLDRTGGGAEAWWGAVDMIRLVLWTTLLLGLALLCPNSAEVLALYEPAIGISSGPREHQRAQPLLWRPTAKWAVIMAAVSATAVLSLGGPSEFLYWQF